MKNIRYKKTTEQDMFDALKEKELFHTMPLSARMRPESIEEYVGQEHILGEGMLLPRAICADRLNSVILYGPPGCGKTTLALCISKKTNACFEKINAVSSNVEEIRRVIASAQNRRLSSGKKTILFIDEIHRFNKSQQDVLMPDLENGNLILVGATVFNPFFSLTSPLLSRSLIFELKPLQPKDLKVIFERAIVDKTKGLGELSIVVQNDALRFLSEISDGDARRGLNALELAIMTTPKNKKGIVVVDLQVAQESIQKKQVNYDRKGDAHFDTASAFIKSMRGSDPDATLYWMAKMLYAGEDPRFVARRICICASEDVGNADPQALVLANSALNVSEFVGMPEARIPLAQAAVYVACAPKSNAVYLGIDNALDDVQNNRSQEVPNHLKDASYKGAKQVGRGEGYKYVHNFDGHYVEQEYISVKKQYYVPTDIGYEKKIRDRIENRKKK